MALLAKMVAFCLAVLVCLAVLTDGRKVRVDFEPTVTALPGSEDVVLVAVEDFTESLSLDSSSGRACELCENVSDKLRAFLADPSTTAQAISAAQTLVCLQLPAELVEKCVVTVEQYVAEVISSLEEAVSRDHLCVETRLCVAVSMLAEDLVEQSTKVEASTAGCKLCRQIVLQVLILLENGNTEQQIITYMHNTCQRFPRATTQCEVLVDQYVPQIISLLEAFTPAEICTALKLCERFDALELPGEFSSMLELPSADVETMLAARERPAVVRLSAESLDLHGVSNPKECAACRFLVAQARKTLSDPDNQVKLTIMLMEACDKLEEYKVQCKAAVIQYLPQLFDNVDNLLDPVTLCKKAKLC